MKKYLIVGAGFSGAVIAEQLAKRVENSEIKVIDKRNHIAGNCYTEKDETTGIMMHKYGPHIFNTDNEKVWNYVQQFGVFRNYTHRVKAIYNSAVYSLPINLHTINQFYGKQFSPNEARAFVESLGDSSIIEPKNFEEQALKMIGRDLYMAFMYGYTKKQWGSEPKDLPASILKRLPVRFNYDDNYYHSNYYGIPENGYTSIIKNILNHDNVNVELGINFDVHTDISSYDHVFYTGPIDAFFEFKYGRLSYRTVTFEKFISDGDFQGASQINYCDEDVPFTRICEHKHFTPWEKYEKTVYFKEYSKETSENDDPYYPKRLPNDMILFGKYTEDVKKLNNVTFLGRLATYRYMDMHHVIGEALDIANKFIVSC
jgi:UDP-galactopyranose mutase